MSSIEIIGTSKTPEINFSSDLGKLLIAGRSIPENSIEFYNSLLEWIDNYSSAPKENTEIDMKLEYFNTSSSKCILDVFKKLENIKKAGNVVKVNWFYEEDDEDMLEAGEDYDAIIDLPFEMKAIDEL